MDFIGKIYKITNKFPPAEMYGLTSQIRRAATSIALNIAEGSGSGSDTEFNRFLSFAHRSNYEVMCALEISKKLEYISEMECEDILKESNELSAMIFSLKKKLIADSRTPTANNGFTLIELMISTMMVVILAGVVIYVFHAILLSWSGSEARAGINITLNRAVEEMRRDVISAKVIASGTNDEVRFTAIDNTNRIYYLYNTNDSYPPSFGQEKYELRKAGLSGTNLTNGAFTYGNGVIILTDVSPPPATDLSFSSNLVTIDLSSVHDDETVRLRTQIKPRNQ